MSWYLLKILRLKGMTFDIKSDIVTVRLKVTTNLKV